MLTQTNIESYRNQIPKTEHGELYTAIVTSSIKETFFKFVENMTDEKVSFCKFRGIELVDDTITINLFFQDIPENKKSMEDLGYEFGRGDVNFNMDVPNDEVYDINFWKTAILNYADWCEYAKITNNVPVSEMFKLLICFFNKISE